MGLCSVTYNKKSPTLPYQSTPPPLSPGSQRHSPFLTVLGIFYEMTRADGYSFTYCDTSDRTLHTASVFSLGNL